MKRDLVFDIINFFVALLIFVLPVYFVYLELPLEIQILPSVLLVVPIVITLYKRRLETERTERQKTISRVKKLNTLLVKLDRIRNVFDIASSLTYNKEIMDDELTSLGWRRYFDRYGREVDSDFASCDYWVGYLIYGPASKQDFNEFHSTIHDFYFVVMGFRQLYDDLANMIQLSEKIPKDQLQNIQELEENFEDFLKALNDWCDEDKEIEKLLEGRYQIRKRLKKISTIHSKTQ